MAAAVLICLAAAATLMIGWEHPVAVAVWRIGAFAAVIGGALTTRSGPVRPGIVTVCLGAVAMWSLAQAWVGSTADVAATLEAAANWGALAAVVYFGESQFPPGAGERRFLQAAAACAAVLAAVCLLQPAATGIGYELFAGPFQNRNTYASWVELTLPIVLWQTRQKDDAAWIWWTVVAAMTASVVATGARAGSLLVITEFIALTVLFRRGVMPVAAAVLVLIWIGVSGAGTLIERVGFEDPFSYRGPIAESAVEMARERPLTGFGAGTWEDIYPRFAKFDIGKRVNHAHSDWIEWAGELGVPATAVLALPWLAALSRLRAKPWGLGLLFVLAHSLVDYPLQRTGLSVWVWLVMAAILTPPSGDPAVVRVRKRAGARDQSLATATH